MPILGLPMDAWILLALAIGLGLGLEVAFYRARRRDAAARPGVSGYGAGVATETGSAPDAPPGGDSSPPPAEGPPRPGGTS